MRGGASSTHRRTVQVEEVEPSDRVRGSAPWFEGRGVKPHRFSAVGVEAEEIAPALPSR